jgi:hypothetical protein
MSLHQPRPTRPTYDCIFVGGGSAEVGSVFGSDSAADYPNFQYHVGPVMMRRPLPPADLARDIRIGEIA